MLTQITEKSSDFVYNYVTQSEVASLSQNMYNSTNFTSDLLNSYSWDTAILFIQKCSTDLDYSKETSPFAILLVPKHLLYHIHSVLFYI